MGDLGSFHCLTNVKRAADKICMSTVLRCKRTSSIPREHRAKPDDIWILSPSTCVIREKIFFQKKVRRLHDHNILIREPSHLQFCQHSEGVLRALRGKVPAKKDFLG